MTARKAVRCLPSAYDKIFVGAHPLSRQRMPCRVVRRGLGGVAVVIEWPDGYRVIRPEYEAVAKEG